MTEYVHVAGTRTRNRVYHTRDCKRRPEYTRQWPKQTAEAWGMEECAYCAGTNDQSENDRSIYQAAKAHGENNA